MKAKILQKLAKTINKKPTTKTMTKEQFEKIRKAKKQTNDLAKKNNVEVGTGKYGSLNNKLSKSIENKNLSEAKKIVKNMKDFIKDVKSKPISKKVTKKVTTEAEARKAAIDAGKKTFNFGGKKNIPVKRQRVKKGSTVSQLTKGMSKEDAAKFKSKRGNELRSLKTAQLKEMMADKYGGGTSTGGVRVQKLTPEGEKLLKENKLSTIVNAQKFIKFKTKDGKTKVVPSNKYIVEGIGSRDAPLVPKGATPKTPADKKAFREYFENEMDDNQRLEYILKRFEPQFTSSQLADKLGITARDLTATIKGGAGKYKQYGIGDAELKALKDKFQVRSISKGMKTGGIVKAKAGTKKKTIGKSKLGKVKGAMLSLMPMGTYDTIDMIDTAIRTGVPFKSGTKGKTIRGCGQAMRGYGKAMTKGKK